MVDVRETLRVLSRARSLWAERWAAIDKVHRFGDHLVDPGQFGPGGFLPTERFVLVEATARGSNEVWVSQHGSPEEAARYHDEGEGSWDIVGLFALDTGQRYKAVERTEFQPVAAAQVGSERVAG